MGKPATSPGGGVSLRSCHHLWWRPPTSPTGALAPVAVGTQEGGESPGRQADRLTGRPPSLGPPGVPTSLPRGLGLVSCIQRQGKCSVCFPGPRDAFLATPVSR